LYFFESFESTDVNIADPFYHVLQLIFIKCGAGAQVFLAAQAGICWVLYSVGAARVDRTYPVLGIGLVPILLVDATFNGLRWGLAFGVTLVVICYVIGKSAQRGTLYSVIPGLFHSSLLLLVLTKGRWFWFIILVLLSAALYAGGFIELLVFYYKIKLVDYSDMQSPSWFSGIGPIIQISLLWVIAKYSLVKFENRQRLLKLGILLSIIAVASLGMSYAFLRVLQVGVFFIFIAVSLSIVKASKFAKITTVVLFVFNLLNFIRIILNEGSQSTSPFLPYRLFWTAGVIESLAENAAGAWFISR